MRGVRTATSGTSAPRDVDAGDIEFHLIVASMALGAIP